MWFEADWPAPASVRAISTDRQGGVSLPPFDGFNLGGHVGDRPEHVTANRHQLQGQAGLPSAPYWLNQVHGTAVEVLPSARITPQADASYSRQAGTVCTVMTADCLPVLLCDRAGTEVAAAHAGWRGLVDGVLEATLAHFKAQPGEILAWLGPAIGPAAFEVGPEVRERFVAQMAEAEQAFVPRGDRYLADLYVLARQRLARAGVTDVYGGQWCTYQDPQRFFSYRRDQQTGRQASLIWLQDA
ncbi:peptidoglycan editing factor PgeF [Ferrimonas balearica]|uniref:peptidoglycan editing factor PgeF n=1 Tax=Ferrimonas balearica TaxID=44012 RepID=UPI001C9939F7|nr:peptidoglycan editing factor PgeF [Ferrimonas balearica]MBY5993422.1 peptidoglycan editing factor PgeF [Ferrimonas balearica]